MVHDLNYRDPREPDPPPRDTNEADARDDRPHWARHGRRADALPDTGTLGVGAGTFADVEVGCVGAVLLVLVTVGGIGGLLGLLWWTVLTHAPTAMP